ncbi:T9SS type A sorting domain-containing protein [Hymenobacter psychrophilus]|uniref:Por secretion system C-terminal sorting domain-containing protein n=1 Tax=Hymenobacter psychrophilus TaxID=651662 RepID=A0A1H3FD90_9BACT|nr:T9SS type A sorting domain-containing protein [Hymenobacter psychrophilus]SDX88890.1 Por secretion system C-terminal sorting domain-containing protein [Hymenobacter psychrophilus]
MLHRYLLLLALLLITALAATAQNWRPFRPNGAVHAYMLSRNGAATDSILTLRLDSAGVRGADSLYFFNRIMRPVKSTNLGERWRKSRNNQFGARLRYEGATRVYWLEWAAEVGEPARSIPLPVFRKAGTTFTGSSGPTATVVSRTVREFNGQSDSVATLQVGTETYELSKNYGLLAGPQTSKTGLMLARLPVAAGLSYYNPLLLANFQPGDEFGYYNERFAFGGGLICEATNLLQRVVSRQQTADSLIYVVRYQSRTRTSGAPGCSAAGTTFEPLRTARLAASLRTGQWQWSPGRALGPSNNAHLLAYEWVGLGTGLTMGHPVVPSRPSGVACSPRAALRTQRLHLIRGGMENVYLPFFDFDWPGLNEFLSADLGVVRLSDSNLLDLVYYRRTSSSGVVATCGTREPFDLLLSAAPGSVASAGVRLYPNPAAITATLELPVPTTAPAHLTLLNGTGQTIRTQRLPSGTTRATVALAGLPVGLYLVRLEQLGSPPLLLRLQRGQ